jgi:hypothetical protein
MKTLCRIALSSLVFILAVTSCTAWYPVRKDQLPLVARVFEPDGPAEVEVATGWGEISVAREDRFQLRAADRLFEGQLDELEIAGVGDQEVLHFELLTSSPSRGVEVPLSEVDTVEVRQFSVAGTIAVCALVTLSAALVVVYRNLDFDFDIGGGH